LYEYESSTSKNDLEQLELTISLPLKLLIGNKLPFLLDMKKLFSRYGMMTEVIQILQVLDRLRPYDEDIQWQLAQAYTKVNDWEKALSAYRVIREITPLYDGMVLIKMGEIYINNMNDHKKGVDSIVEALDAIDDNLKKGNQRLAMVVDEATTIDIMVFLCDACNYISDIKYTEIQKKYAEKILKLERHNERAAEILQAANMRLSEMGSNDIQP
jgi:tetratricopeptide (TPR) repeat protein